MSTKNTKRNAWFIYQIKYVLCAKVLQDLNGTNHSVRFVDDYGSMILETERKATKEEPKTEHKKFPLEFIKIKNVEKNINEQTIKEY